MTFTTTSGSTYELNYQAKSIRRIAGKPHPSLRGVNMAQWQAYVAISEVTVGRRVIVDWPDGFSMWTMPVRRIG